MWSLPKSSCGDGVSCKLRTCIGVRWNATENPATRATMPSTTSEPITIAARLMSRPLVVRSSSCGSTCLSNACQILCAQSSKKIERTVALERDVHELSGLRFSRKIDSTIDARCLTHRSAKPRVRRTDCLPDRVGFAQSSPLFNQNANVLAGSASPCLLRCEPLRFAQAHQTPALLAGRYL